MKHDKKPMTLKEGLKWDWKVTLAGALLVIVGFGIAMLGFTIAGATGTVVIIVGFIIVTIGAFIAGSM